MTDTGVPREHRIRTTRRARYYVLPAERVDGLQAAPPETWLVCHGFGQLAEPFISTCRVLAQAGCDVVAPEALNRFYLQTSGSHANAPVGATWMTREDRLAEIEDYVDYLDAVRREAVAHGSRLTVLGFSQGVATVTRWVALGSADAHRLVLWAGAIPPELDVVALASRVATPIVLVSGERDELAQWSKWDEQLARFQAAGVPYETRRFAGGHRLDNAVLTALAG